MIDHQDIRKLAHGAATECARIVTHRTMTKPGAELTEVFKGVYDDVFDHVLLRIRGDKNTDCSCYQNLHERIHREAMRQALK